MKERKSLFTTALLIVFLDVFMKLFGFLKQVVIANFFGATGQTDIYFVANGFIVGISSAIISSAKISVISIFSSIRVKEGKESGDNFISNILIITVVLSFILIFVMILFSNGITYVLAPSFNMEQKRELSHYLNIMSGIFWFTGVVTIFEAVLNSNEKFLLVKTRSFFYSLCIILGCFWGASKIGLSVLIISQYLSFIIYALILFFASGKYFKIHFTLPHIDINVKKVLALTLPVIIGNSTIQINYLVDKAVATSVGTGVVSALSYSQIVDQAFTVILITSICSFTFSRFANFIAQEKQEEILKTLDMTIGILVLILIPVSLIVFIRGKDIVNCIYLRGNFSYEMAALTAIAVQGYVIRYPFIAIRDVLAQGMYAYQNTKGPMINSCISTFINIIISVIGSRYIGFRAIIAGTVVSAIIGMLLNAYTFKMIVKIYNFTSIIGIFLKSLPSIGMCLIILWLQNKFFYIEIPILRISFSAIIICVIYYLCMILLKEKNCIRFLKMLLCHIFHG